MSTKPRGLELTHEVRVVPTEESGGGAKDGDRGHGGTQVREQPGRKRCSSLEVGVSSQGSKILEQAIQSHLGVSQDRPVASATGISLSLRADLLGISGRNQAALTQGVCL